MARSVRPAGPIGGSGGGAGYVLRMRAKKKILTAGVLLGMGVFLSACASTTYVRTETQRRAVLHRAPASGPGWDAVMAAPEVVMDQRRLDRRILAEATRRDTALSKSRPEAISAIAASWPAAVVPSLDYERTGRTSTNPERFIYSGDIGRYRGYYRSGYSRYRY